MNFFNYSYGRVFLVCVALQINFFYLDSSSSYAINSIRFALLFVAPFTIEKFLAPGFIAFRMREIFRKVKSAITFDDIRRRRMGAIKGERVKEGIQTIGGDDSERNKRDKTIERRINENA